MCRWTYTYWAVRLKDGNLLSDVNGPVLYLTRKEARDEAKIVCGVPICAWISVEEYRR